MSCIICNSRDLEFIEKVLKLGKYVAYLHCKVCHSNFPNIWAKTNLINWQGARV